MAFLSALTSSNPFAGLASSLQRDLGPLASSLPRAVSGTPSAFSPPASNRGAEDGQDLLSTYQKQIGHFESGGNYQALGPHLKNGDRAYGKYQVLGTNVGPWTERYYGKALTPKQFLADPQAQDAVFRGQFGAYLKRYGTPQDAASMWFSGRPYARGRDLRDQVTNISGKQYVARTVGQGAASPQPSVASSGGPQRVASSGQAAPSGNFDYTGPKRDTEDQGRHRIGQPDINLPDLSGTPQDTSAYQGPDPEALRQLQEGNTQGLKRLPPEVSVDTLRAYGASKRLTVGPAQGGQLA